jgi:hypothetical protein
MATYDNTEVGNLRLTVPHKLLSFEREILRQYMLSLKKYSTINPFGFPTDDVFDEGLLF